MYAAVVTSFDAPPAYLEFPSPVPAGSDQVLVDVVASGLHRRVRSQADGSHYTSTGELPLVPGVDGVARLPEIPSAALRELPLQIVGSGQGSVSTRDILAELPAIAEAITSGALRIDARGVPLRDVTSAWQDVDGTERIVLMP